MEILIKTIPHKKQRYETHGDWYVDNKGRWIIRVSEFSNWKHAFAIIMHELSEMAECIDKGMPEQDITDFDIQLVKSGQKGEPGDSKRAPYYKQHQHATIIERQIIQNLGEDWNDYLQTNPK